MPSIWDYLTGSAQAGGSVPNWFAAIGANAPAMGEAMGGLAAPPIVPGMLQSAAQLAMYPGQVFQQGLAGNAPSVAEMVPWAANMAQTTAGLGSPFAAAGSVGSAGGRLLTPGATAEEINRAAASSAGMTQKGVRDLYNQLGLTGGPIDPLLMPSLASPSPEALQAATMLKQQDMAAMNALSPADRALFVKGKLKNFQLPSQQAAEEAAKGFEPIKKQVKKAEQAFDVQRAQGTAPSLFDLSAGALAQTPDVPQFSLPRVAPKITERIAPAFEGGAGLQRIEEAAGKASPADWGWYNIDQMRQAFHAIHGPAQGEAAYQAWLDGLAGTSMVNPISSNVRSSTDYLGRILRGEPLPETIPVTDPETGRQRFALAAPPPVGYGAKAQQQHADRVREFLSNVGDPVANAKPFTYRQNLGGNWASRTVDTHDIRNMLGMPYALSAIGENAGLLPGEYAALEGLGQQAATRAGVPQAAQQGATWIGGGPYTQLKSIPIPLQDEINRRIHVTAAVRGEKPEDTLTKMIRGQLPFLGLGGAIAAPMFAGRQQQ
jgi:hypothetical protein